MRRRIPKQAYEYIHGLIEDGILFGVLVPNKLQLAIWQSEIQSIPQYRPASGYINVSNKVRFPTVYGVGGPIIFPNGFHNPIKAITNDKDRLFS